MLSYCLLNTLALTLAIRLKALLLISDRNLWVFSHLVSIYDSMELAVLTLV